MSHASRCPGIAIDMGSGRTRAWTPGHGVVLDVPTVSVTDSGTGHPVRRGRIVEAEACARMLRRLLGRRFPHWSRPLVVITTPVLCGDAHRAAVRRALGVINPRAVLTLDSAKAAALGARADLARPLFVVDIGAHLTEAALLSGGGVAHARRVDSGLSDLPGSTTPQGIARTVRDLVSDIVRHDRSGRAFAAAGRGVLLVGGGALRPELTRLLATRLGTSVQSAAAPHTAVLRGAAAILQSARDHPVMSPR